MYSNDRKAPRMKKGEFSFNIINKDLWKEFHKIHPEITWEEFYNSWLDIAETIREESVYNPLGVKLGHFMGELKYQYLPTKKKAPDNSISEELGERVNFPNITTRDKVGKLKWERRWAVKFNKMLQFYGFEPTRDITKMAEQRTLENPDNIRVARNTLGGFSIWRKLKNYGK